MSGVVASTTFFVRTLPRDVGQAYERAHISIVGRHGPCNLRLRRRNPGIVAQEQRPNILAIMASYRLKPNPPKMFAG